jgi:ATP-dependent HslUV protease subunit HslV
MEQRIVLLRKKGETVVAGDGQVSLGNTVLKSKAKKVRKIESRGVIAWIRRINCRCINVV